MQLERAGNCLCFVDGAAKIHVNNWAMRVASKIDHWTIAAAVGSIMAKQMENRSRQSKQQLQQQNS